MMDAVGGRSARDRVAGLMQAPLDILVVDDESIDVQLVTSLLHGFLSGSRVRVDSAGNYDQAIAMLEKVDYDGVYVDYDLPGLSGLKVLEYIRNMTDGPPAVMLTGQGGEAVAAEAFRLGASDYLMKSALSPAVIQQSVIHLVSMAGLVRAQTVADARVAAIMQAAADPILGISLDGTITQWNDGATNAYGIQRGDAVGRQISDLGHPDDAAEYVGFLDAIKNGETVPRIELEHVTAKGQTMDVVMGWAPVFDRKRRVVGGSVVVHNVSELKRLRSIGAAHEKSLEAENYVLRHIGQMISHDLREPVRMLLVKTEMLAKEHPSDTTEAIARAASRLGEMLGGFLELSGLDPNPGTRKVDSNELVAGVVASMDSDEEGTPIEWDIGDIPPVRGDTSQLELVLMNLLWNARKYGPDKLKVSIRGSQSGGKVRIVIRDNGPGVPSEFRKRIFDPFQRGPLHGKPGGTGMGLFTCDVIARRHGGEVGITNHEGPGAEFYVELMAA